MSLSSGIKELNRRVIHGVAFRGLTLSYIGTVILLALVAGGFISIATMLVIETLMVVGLQLALMERVSSVEHMVNSQHDLLTAINDQLESRVKQLMDAMTDAGVPVPPEKILTEEGPNHGAA